RPARPRRYPPAPPERSRVPPARAATAPACASKFRSHPSFGPLFAVIGFERKRWDVAAVRKGYHFARRSLLFYVCEIDLWTPLASPMKKRGPRWCGATGRTTGVSSRACFRPASIAALRAPRVTLLVQTCASLPAERKRVKPDCGHACAASQTM